MDVFMSSTDERAKYRVLVFQYIYIYIPLRKIKTTEQYQSNCSGVLLALLLTLNEYFTQWFPCIFLIFISHIDASIVYSKQVLANATWETIQIPK